MKRIRGFEVDKLGKKFENKAKRKILLPRRSTIGSAGYDFRSIDNITVPSYSNLFQEKRLKRSDMKFDSMKDINAFSKWCRNKKLVTIVHTGIKAYFPRTEVLKMYNRSSNPIKRGLILANGVGIIDSDYYSNPSNDGELCAEFINLSLTDYHINIGDRIMQGVFEPYLLADNDNPVSQSRSGGFGSTGTK